MVVKEKKNKEKEKRRKRKKKKGCDFWNLKKRWASEKKKHSPQCLV
jgi:hypothetical protein